MRLEFAYDGGGLGKGGESRSTSMGHRSGPAGFERTQPFVFSGDEAFDIGNEFGSLVTTDYDRTKFDGDVTWARIDLGLDDHDHLVDPEHRLNVAMAIQ